MLPPMFWGIRVFVGTFRGNVNHQTRCAIQRASHPINFTFPLVSIVVGKLRIIWIAIIGSIC
jgi:hypothetical protein